MFRVSISDDLRDGWFEQLVWTGIKVKGGVGFGDDGLVRGERGACAVEGKKEQTNRPSRGEWRVVVLGRAQGLSGVAWGGSAVPNVRGGSGGGHITWRAVAGREHLRRVWGHSGDQVVARHKPRASRIALQRHEVPPIFTCAGISYSAAHEQKTPVARGEKT